MMEYIPCYSVPTVHWGLLPATRLASRKMLIEQMWTGPALCVFSLLGFDSETKAEAAKGKPYCWPMLRAIQLSSTVRCTPATEEGNYDVMSSIDNVHLTFKKRYA
jgi:hypothetical protein